MWHKRKLFWCLITLKGKFLKNTVWLIKWPSNKRDPYNFSVTSKLIILTLWRWRLHADHWDRVKSSHFRPSCYTLLAVTSWSISFSARPGGRGFSGRHWPGYSLLSPLVFAREKVAEKQKEWECSPARQGGERRKDPGEGVRAWENIASGWKINEHGTQTTKISQHTASASWQPESSRKCVACHRTHGYLFIGRVLLLLIRDAEFSWWIEFLSVLGGKRWRRLCWRLWFPHRPWQLPFPGQLLALHGSCVVRGAPETTVVSSRTWGSNRVISVRRVSKGNEKQVGTDGRIYLLHSPLVHLTNSFARGMFVFHSLTFFFPR